MFWVIATIVIIGLVIVAAINRNTQVKLAIAEQEQQDKINSPEYQAQARASLDHFRYLNDVLDIKIRIAESKIKLKKLPSFISIWQDQTDKSIGELMYLTDSKQVYEESKKNGTANVKFVTKQEMIEAIKADIADDEGLLKQVAVEYKESQKEYTDYKPENLEITKTKYELDVPFPSDMSVGKYGYINEDNASSWSMYEERKTKLSKLERQLA